MELTEGEKDGAWIITVAGEVDLAVAEELREAIGRAAPSKVVLVDLGPCEFIDSTAIAVLVAAHKAHLEEGRRFAAIGPTKQVRRVLELTGLDRHGLVFDRVEDVFEIA